MTCAESEELEPPWSRLPWIQSGSIGWRMGIGEGYQMQWGDTITTICPDFDAGLAYLHRHPPAPRTWHRWITSWLAELANDDQETDDEDEEARPPTQWDLLVETEGLTADDAAYPVFVRNALREGGMGVPWGWRDQTPRTVLRYSARELAWWARWMVTECPDRDGFLDEHETAPSGWVEIDHSARTGVATIPIETGGIEALICTLVATGTLPPPWLAGHEPRGSVEYGDLADDRDYWSWWVGSTFDDRASWERYIAPWPPTPAWQRFLDDDYFLPTR